MLGHRSRRSVRGDRGGIIEGGGFGWLKPPPRQVLENYWKGVLLVPERRLVVGRLDGIIAGSAQLAGRRATTRRRPSRHR